MKASIYLLLAAAAFMLCTPSEGLAQDHLEGRWSDTSGVVYNLWPVGEPDPYGGQYYEGVADFSKAPGYQQGSWLSIHGYGWQLWITGTTIAFYPEYGFYAFDVDEAVVFSQQPSAAWPAGDCNGSCAGLFAEYDGDGSLTFLVDVWLKEPPSLSIQPSWIAPGGCFNIHVPNAPYLPVDVQYTFNGGEPQYGSDQSGNYFSFWVNSVPVSIPVWQQLDANGDAEICVDPQAESGVYEFSYIWNPVAPGAAFYLETFGLNDAYFAPTPVETRLSVNSTTGPFLSKEYIYLGGRILAVDQP